MDDRENPARIGERIAAGERCRLRADWIFPVSSPPISDAILECEAGAIVQIGSRRGEAVDFDFGRVALLPPLVNAHTHLDLSGAVGKLPPSEDPIAWIKSVIRFRISQSPEQTDAAIRDGIGRIAEAGRGGSSLIGDISTVAYPEECRHPKVRLFPFVEVLGLTAERQNSQWSAFADRRRVAGGSGSLGISPHAPYSTSRKLYEAAAALGIPVCTHLGEFREEAELLGERAGPFAAFLRDVGIWLPEELAPSWDWILATLPRGSLIAHANYLPADSLKRAGHSVVYCPRTHAAFGHPPHPFREFLEAGINVCLGTDSLASNPDLDIFAEAVHIHREYPNFPGERLLQMLTVNGAKALGIDDSASGLPPRSWTVVPLPQVAESDPYRLLFSAERRPAAPRFPWPC